VEAEAEADRLVEERLGALGELTDALVAQADAIRRQSELLSDSLREAKARLESDVGPAPVRPPAEPVDDEPEEPAGGEVEELNGNGSLGPVPEPPAPRLTAVEPPSPEPRIGGFGAPRGSGTPAGARLLATQMAVSGSTREEIAARLRNGFEIEDADAILDAILGP